MKLRFCPCRSCRRGRKKARHQAQIEQRKAGHRNYVRRLLRDGEYERLPTAIAVGYTD